MSPISGSGKVGADVVVGSNKGAGAAWGVGYDGSGSSGDDARGDSGFDGSVGAMLAVSSESGSAGHTETMDELGSDTRTDDAAGDMGTGMCAGDAWTCVLGDAGSGTGNVIGVAVTSGVSSSVGMGLYPSATRRWPGGLSVPGCSLSTSDALPGLRWDDTTECHGE